MSTISKVFKHNKLVLLIAMAFSVGVFPALAQNQTDTVVAYNDFSDVYNAVSPSVVAISVTSARSNVNAVSQPVQSGGTGFVYDNQGHIVTNNHVVEGATEIVVSFLDGTLAYAGIVGLDPDSDLAVIRVDLPASDLAELQPVTFGNSDVIEVGDPVLAIGSPFGQRWTLTTGIVSALQRTIQGIGNFSIGGVIQTDAAINPGNSGGPLLTTNGEVIGVNSQIISASGASAGIGFAIPGNLAQRVIPELIENGTIDYSYIGISGGEVTIEVIEAFNLSNDTQGIIVGESTQGGPADIAGIQDALVSQTGQLVRADIITAINGVDVNNIGDLITYLATNTRPSDTVELTVLRDGTTTLTIPVTLSARPNF